LELRLGLLLLERLRLLLFDPLCRLREEDDDELRLDDALDDDDDDRSCRTAATSAALAFSR
jgi:hypothetical protein